MPLNATGMVSIANSLRATLLYAQLHEGLAGVTYMDNIAVAGRELVVWNTPSAGGNFGLISPLDFTSGTPAGPVYSVTLWDAETGGACHGEFALSGDPEFNISGNYSVTAIDFTGTTS